MVLEENMTAKKDFLQQVCAETHSFQPVELVSLQQ